MLNLDAVICRLGKIANNLEKHGEEDVTEFNIPVSGIMLSGEQLNAFIGDPHCDRSWFNTRGNIREPMPWWGRGDFRLEDRFVANVCTITVTGDRELEFKPEKELPACSIGKIHLKPQVGGFTEMSFQLQLRPGIGKSNLLLQEHQNREVRLTVSESHVALNKGKQQDLPLDAPPAGTIAGNGAMDGVDGPTQDKRMRQQLAAKRAREGKRARRASGPFPTS